MIQLSHRQRLAGTIDESRIAATAYQQKAPQVSLSLRGKRLGTFGRRGQCDSRFLGYK